MQPILLAASTHYSNNCNSYGNWLLFVGDNKLLKAINFASTTTFTRRDPFHLQKNNLVWNIRIGAVDVSWALVMCSLHHQLLSPPQWKLTSGNVSWCLNLHYRLVTKNPRQCQFLRLAVSGVICIWREFIYVAMGPSCWSCNCCGPAPPSDNY